MYPCIHVITLLVQLQVLAAHFMFFLRNFQLWLTYYLLKHLPLVITGDFNIHVDNDTDTNAVAFNNLLSACGLTQHIDSSTHKCGHTLDLFITRSVDAPIFHNLQVKDDHSAIRYLLDLKRPAVPTETIVTRQLNAIDIDAFCEDISRSDLNSSHVFSDLDLTTQVNIYSDTLTSLLVQHAPDKTRTVKIRPNKSWYNDMLFVKRSRTDGILSMPGGNHGLRLIANCTVSRNRKLFSWLGKLNTTTSISYFLKMQKIRSDCFKSPISCSIVNTHQLFHKVNQMKNWQTSSLFSLLTK